MKKIPLTQGKFALVDDEDFEYLSQWKWHLTRRKKKCYAARNRRRNEPIGPPIILMHKVLCNGKLVDHKDENGLNNTKSNLRSCSNAENLSNRGKQRNNTSGYKGVTWDKFTNKWMAQLSSLGKAVHIGRFDSKKEAAEAYDKAALQYFGEFANLNLEKP